MAKYSTFRYSDPIKVRYLIQELLGSHECGSSGPSSEMDVTNNKVALEFVRLNLSVYGPWYNRNTTVNLTDDAIASTINSYPYYKVTANQIGNYNNTSLVYLIEH